MAADEAFSSQIASSDVATYDARSQYEWVANGDYWSNILQTVNADGCAVSTLASSPVCSLDARSQYEWKKEGDTYVSSLQPVNADGCAVSAISSAPAIAISAKVAYGSETVGDGIVRINYDSAWKNVEASAIGVFWIDAYGHRHDLGSYASPCAGMVDVDVSDGRQGWRTVGIAWKNADGDDLCVVTQCVYSSKLTYSEWASSPHLPVDALVTNVPLFATESVRVTASTAWDTGAESATISLASSKASSNVLTLSAPNATEEKRIDLAARTAGYYSLTHTVTGSALAAPVTQTATLVKCDPRETVVHDGEIVAENVTWDKSKTHVIRGELTVIGESVLTIPAETIVKFVTGGKIVVEDGSTCFATGVIFTHVHDDTVGGDTAGDGDATTAPLDAYSFSGNIVDDETTEYRYVAPVEAGGAITHDTVWYGHKVYTVANDVTVNAGVTLTIRPGAIVKFATGKGLSVVSGAKLVAEGTRAMPIVFTSAKDDAHGGDSNGDGATTRAEPGDWTKVTVKGVATFAHAKFLYGSHGSGTDDVLLIDGGTATLNDCRLEHGQMYAIGLESGHLYMTNSVIADFFCAFRHWASDPIVNSVIYDCSKLSNNDGQNFVNSIIYCIAEAWDWSGGDGNTYDHCVVYNPSEYALQSSSLTLGDAGSQWNDPLFEDFIDFKLKEKSPCIDAGNGLKTSARDHWNHKRVNIHGSEQKGVADAKGIFPDVGIYEHQPRTVASDVDLEILLVTAPSELTMGEEMTVTWTTLNNGSAYVKDLWRDVIEFVAEGGTVTEIATVAQSGGLAAGGKRTFSATVRMPSVAGLKGTVRVTVNKLRDIYEGAMTENNRLSASVSTVALPSVTVSLGMPFAIMSEGTVQTVRKLETDATAPYGLLIACANGGLSSVRLAYGTLPSPGNFDAEAVKLPSGRFLLDIDPSKGAAYVAFGFDSEDDAREIRCTPMDCPSIVELSKEAMPATGKSTVSVFGCGLSGLSDLRLTAEGEAELVGSVTSTADGEKIAAFGLNRAAAGRYSVSGVVDGAVLTSDCAIQIEDVEGEDVGALKLLVEGPSSIRSMRWYTVTVSVINETAYDLAVPLVVLKADDVVFRDPDDDVSVSTNVIQLLPLSKSGDRTLVAAHSTNTVSVSAMLGLQGERLGIVGRLISFDEVGWDTILSQGTYGDAEWDAYLDGVTNGYATAEEFMEQVVQTAANCCRGATTPRNAFTLVQLQTRIDAGEKVATVSGYVLDGETGNPVSGEHFSLATTNGEDAVATVTDENGHFVAYGVPLGRLAFLSADNEIYSSEELTLTEAGLDGVILKKSPVVELTETATEATLEYQVYTGLTLLPQNGGTAVWADGSNLKFRTVGAATSDQSVDVGAIFSEFVAHPCLDGSCYFAGVSHSTDGTNWLHVAQIACDSAGQWRLVRKYGVPSVNSLSSLKIVRCDDASITIGYDKSSAKTGRAFGYYELPIALSEFELCPNVAMAVKSASAAPRLLSSSSRSYGIPSFVSDALNDMNFGLDLDGITVSGPAFSVSESESCCKKTKQTKVGFSISTEVSGNRELSFGYNVEEAQVMRCGRYFNPSSGDCKGLGTEWYSHKMDGNFAFAAGPSIDLPMGENEDSILSKLFTLEVGCSAGPAVRYQQMIWQRNGRQGEASMDYFMQGVTYTFSGEAHATLKFGSARSDDGGSGVKSKLGWSGEWMDLKGELSASITATRDNHGNGKWDSTGVISGQFSGMGVTATASWTRSGNDWHYSCSVSKDDPNSGSKENSEKPSPVSTSEENPLDEDDDPEGGDDPEIGDEPANEENAGEPKSVSTSDDGDEHVYSQEHDSDTGRRSSLHVRDKSGKTSRMPSSNLNVGDCDITSKTPTRTTIVCGGWYDPVGTEPEDVLAAMYDKRLYTVTYTNGAWGVVSDVTCLPQDARVGGFKVIRDSVTTDALVLYESVTLDVNDGTNEVRTLEGLVVHDGGSVTALGTIVNESELPVHAVSATMSNGVASVVYSAGQDNEDDALYVAGYDGTGWTNRVVSLMPKVATAATVTSVLSTDNAATPLMASKALANSSASCGGSCKCGCAKAKPRPSVGCGCKKTCKCKGLCGSKCQCVDEDDESVSPDPDGKKSIDPNEISGPEGVGTGRFVNAGEWLDFTIYFENKAEATAAAQEIWITLPKDPWLDWSTFALGEVALGGSVDTALSGKAKGSSTMSLDDVTFGAKTTATTDDESVLWYLRAWDATTVDNFPEDAYEGILPPNDAATHCGEGHVTYRIKVRDDAPSRVCITNEATIVFDYNEAITTDPNWWNTVGEVIDVSVEGEDESMKFVVDEPFGELPTPEARPHYDFLGWFTDPVEGDTPVTPSSTVPSGLTALYQRWQLRTHEVIVDGVGQMYAEGSMLNLRTFASVTNGLTNIVCLGWCGTGDVPATGTDTQVGFEVTQPSTLTWLYETNYWVTVRALGGGEVSMPEDAATNGWMTCGTELTLNACCDALHCFVAWTNDCDLVCLSTDTSIVVSVDLPIKLTAAFAEKRLPEVLKFATCDWAWQMCENATWKSVCLADATQGCALRSGEIGDAASSWIEARIASRGTLTFRWKTSCETRYDYATVSVDGVVKGKISGIVDWQELSLDIPSSGAAVRWTYVKGRSGEDGEDCVWLDWMAWREYEPPTLTEALDATNLTWTVSGDGNWSVAESGGADGREYGRSGVISDYGVSTLGTYVYGPGRLSFTWRVSCEDGYDYCDFYVDGVWRNGITGESPWTEVSYDITEGRHELVWEYWKDELDDPENVGEDMAGLDLVKWTPTRLPQTATTDVPIPYEWLYQIGAVSGVRLQRTEEFELAANSIGANGIPLWNSYVAGLDPTNENSKFTAKIKLLDGVPKITWDPDLSSSLTPRKYTTFGKRTLLENGWTDQSTLTEEEKKEFHFFKVTVEVP